MLIGRQAVIAYGGPVQTMDFDLYVDGSEENTARLLKAAKKFGLSPNLSPEELTKHFKFKLENDFAVDIFRAKSFYSSEKRFTFEELFARKVVAKGEEGLELNLPAIDDLIALKKLRSAPKDLEDIKYLKALKEEK